MVSQGFRVFPCKPRGKTPLVKDWAAWSSEATEQTIIEFASRNPGCNWAVALGPDHIVLDIDDGLKPTSTGFKRTHGKSNLRNKLTGITNPLPKTLIVKTPSGGLHLYYRGQGKNTASVICQDVDTKTAGGYVLAPASVGIRHESEDDFDGTSAYYEIENAGPIVDAPQWLSDAFDSTAKKAVAPVLPERVHQGSRNHALASLAGSIRARGANYETVLAALEAFNRTQIDPPLSQYEVEAVARSVSRYEPQHAKVAAEFTVTAEEPWAFRRVCDIRPADIPPRDWVLADCYLGKFITVLISPGGVGKSTIGLLDALSIATGEPLSGHAVIKQGGVLIYNAEDPLDELERRAAAMAQHHNIKLADIPNVHLLSGRSKPIVFAKPDSNGDTVINEDAIKRLADWMVKNGIVWAAFDPFVRTHGVNENDNRAIDKVAQAYQLLAELTGSSIAIVHHTNKGAVNAEDSANANHARGASALVNAARIAHVLTNMRDPGEATKAGFPPEMYRWYFKRESAKANLTAPADKAEWYKRVSCQLPNGETVGVCERAQTAALIVMERERLLNGIRERAQLQCKPGAGAVPYSRLHPYVSNSAKAKADIIEALKGRREYRCVDAGVIRLTDTEIHNAAIIEALNDFL
jgi:hypothetical protein